jgi:hypothetical protein
VPVAGAGEAVMPIGAGNLAVLRFRVEPYCDL